MAINFSNPVHASTAPVIKAEPAKETPNKIVVKPVVSTGNDLAASLKKIRKELGDNSIVSGSEIPKVSRLATGIFEFDLATGGGFPRGRYSIVYGPESSGKTNLVYKAIAAAQRLPPPCNKAVLVDLEGTFDADFAVQFGVDVDALIVAKPSYGEQAVDMIDQLIRADDVAFLGLDSIATVVAARELDGSTEKMDVGTAAILVKRLANKLAVGLSEEGKKGHFPAVVLINQTRMKIGVMFGNPETQPGGKTVLFNASLIVRISGHNKLVKEISGSIPAFKETKAVIKKAKVGIVQEAFEYDLCMLSHDALIVGETDSWGKVKGYLQASAHLVKDPKKGWNLFGENYPTLDLIQAFYRSDDTFALRCQQQVVANHKMVVVAAQSLVEPEDGA